ncbi:hypothetical protein [Flavobacterium yafengii]|uniref:hypothetical protein n=1 Tax=Flavobacterium yafengii TaxID=3041253 RepID=UPI0024A8EB84|nr:hypothetical protein [Flavobacterium yafengii]MDI6047541.1 hypothetical protein [Flavobacterium yafengii]
MDKIITNNMTEKEINEYWESMDKKADILLEILKGISYSEVKQILIIVNNKISVKVENTII